MKSTRFDRPAIILVLFLSIFATKPLWRTGMFSGHDPVVRDFHRLSEFSSGLYAGDLLPRWQQNFYFGYGYPFFNFYQPLFYYTGSVFKLAGMSIKNSLKAAIYVGMAGSGLMMYICARSFWGTWGGLVAAVAYMLAPYHLADLYVRTSLSEFFSFVFFPMTFFLLRNVLEKKKHIGLFAPALGLLILSHNAEALVFTAFLAGVIILWSIIRGSFKTTFLVMSAWLLGLGSSIFFWLPALVEQKYVQIGRLTEAGYNATNHLLFWAQLIENSWGREASGIGYEKFPFSIGYITIIALFSGLAPVMKIRDRNRFWIFVLIAYGIFLALMMSQIAAPLWMHLHLLKLIQFPWRLLAPLSFVCALLSGSFILLVKSSQMQYVIGILLICALCVYSTPGLWGIHYLDLPDSEMTPEKISGRGVTTTASNEYLPLTASEEKINQVLSSERTAGWDSVLQTAPVAKFESRVEIIQGSGIIDQIEEDYLQIGCVIDCIEDCWIRVNTLYFPGWKTSVDEIETGIDADEYGLIRVKIPGGTHRLKIYFEETPVRYWGRLISIGSWITILAVVIAGAFMPRGPMK